MKKWRRDISGDKRIVFMAASVVIFFTFTIATLTSVRIHSWRPIIDTAEVIGAIVAIAAIFSFFIYVSWRVAKKIFPEE